MQNEKKQAPERRPELPIRMEGEKSEGRGAEAEEITALAQWHTHDNFNDHSQRAKGLIKAITPMSYAKKTEDATYLQKSKSRRSAEQYLYNFTGRIHENATGNISALNHYVSLPGAYPSLLGVILDTVTTICIDPQAENYQDEYGYIWITENHIIEEARRTTAGTVKAKDYKRDQRIINAGMDLLSGMQWKGVDVNGDIIESRYFLNAERYAEVTFNGSTYKNVWRVDPRSVGIAQQAMSRGHARSYPLLETNALTLEEKCVLTHINDMLHQLRHKLYLANGKPKKTKEATLKRRWDSIFQERYDQPGNPLDNRQRERIIATYGRLLEIVAGNELHDEYHTGRPLYLKAWITRKPTKGKRRSAAVYLIIEAKSTLHKPIITFS